MNQDNIIIVTGGSRGIGAAICEMLAESGHMVAAISRSGAMPQLAEGPLRSRVHAFAADVTQAHSVREAFRQVAALGFPIRGLVNNAGIHLQGASHSFSMADYDSVFDTNARAVLVGCQEAYPHLLAAGGGTIVNIGSFFDKLGVKHNLAYCASKAAVGAMTRCLAVEWASKRIAVIDVAPGYIVTDLNREAMEQGLLRAYLEKRIPRGTAGAPEDVARIVNFLFKKGTGFLTGETIYVDGAQGVAH